MNILSKFNSEISQLISLENGSKVVVSVSGGSDSLSLCFLLKKWLSQVNIKLIAVIIDHKLRAESSKEADKVNILLRSYGFESHVIAWEGEKPSSNLQEKARLARYKLLTDYCHKNNISHIFTGHQLNDQAENFIIRADHGSGVYGLSGISKSTEFNGIKIIRPLLNFSKEELQDFLKSKNIEWVEDPSNHNEDFARVRARNFLKKHPEWTPKLVSLSKNLSRARDAIEYMVNKYIADIVTFGLENVVIELRDFNQLPQEIRFRMISKILQFISKKDKPARGERIENLLSKLELGKEFKASTLSGCLIRRKKDTFVITEELNR